MTNYFWKRFSILSLLLVMPAAFGTTVGAGGEVSMIFAIQEFCNARHPEYRQQNDAAFKKWEERNRSAVGKAKANSEYVYHMEAARKWVAAFTADQSSQQVCSELATKLSDPQFNPPLQYSAKPIEAWVVDAATDQPLEGVTVLATWEVEGEGNKYQIKILETLTDKKGRIYFPAWGPEPTPSTLGFIHFRDPLLILFKPNYKWEGRENIVVSRPRLGSIRYSDWDGRTIKMQKASSQAEYLDKFSSFNRELDRVLASSQPPCDWKRAPLMVAAVMKEENWLKKTGPRTISSFESRLRTNEQYFAMNGCGSVNAFLDGLSP